MPRLNATSPTTSFTACILAPVIFLSDELETISAMRSASYTAANVLLFLLSRGSRRKKKVEKKVREQ